MKRFITGAAVVVIIATSVFLYYMVSAPCLVLRNGDTGKLLAAFPVKSGSEFSVTFIHSVNQSPVTDVYEIRDSEIYVVRTVYCTFGAGVQTELEDGQTLEYGKDGSMTVKGFDRRIERLSYIVGTVSDHTLEINGKSISLRGLCGRNATVGFSCRRRIFPQYTDDFR